MYSVMPLSRSSINDTDTLWRGSPVIETVEGMIDHSSSLNPAHELLDGGNRSHADCAKVHHGFEVEDFTGGNYETLTSSDTSSASVTQREVAYLCEYWHDEKHFQVKAYREVDPLHIRYSQDSIYNKFANGRLVDDMMMGILNKTVLPEDIPLMRIVERSDGYYTSLDNVFV